MEDKEGLVGKAAQRSEVIDIVSFRHAGLDKPDIHCERGIAQALEVLQGAGRRQDDQFHAVPGEDLGISLCDAEIKAVFFPAGKDDGLRRGGVKKPPAGKADQQPGDDHDHQGRPAAQAEIVHDSR